MPNRRLRLLLFLSSYSPAFLMFAIRYEGRDCVLFVTSIVLLAAGIFGAAAFLIGVRRRDPEKAFVGEVEPRDADLAGYLVGYLLPVASFEASGWHETVPLAIFLCILALVYVNSRMIYVNPLLAIFGFHLYLVRETNDPEISDVSAMRGSYMATHEEWLKPGGPFTVRRVMRNAVISLRKDQRDAS